jgi:putative addiction module CopG family antidote
MAIEQMNISLPPKMARFIRGKVKAGEYTNASEVVRDAVRQMQEVEAAKKERRAGLNGIEPDLSDEERAGIGESVRQGIHDLENGDYEEFDEVGLSQYFAEVNERGKKRFAAKAKRSS